jgi:hypothetical protein
VEHFKLQQGSQAFSENRFASTSGTDYQNPLHVVSTIGTKALLAAPYLSTEQGGFRVEVQQLTMQTKFYEANINYETGGVSDPLI